MTGLWSMSIYLKKKKSHNLVGWWSVDFLLIEMKTLLIRKEKSHLYHLFILQVFGVCWNSMDCIDHGAAKSWTRPSDFHFTVCWAPWIPQRGNRPGASLCLSALEFHINGTTPYALCWLFKNSEWCFAVICGVARISFLFKLCRVPLYSCLTIGLRIHLLLDVWVVSSSGSVNKALMIIHGQVVWCPLCSFLLALYLGVELLVRQ